MDREFYPMYWKRFSSLSLQQSKMVRVLVFLYRVSLFAPRGGTLQQLQNREKLYLLCVFSLRYLKSSIKPKVNVRWKIIYPLFATFMPQPHYNHIQIRNNKNILAGQTTCIISHMPLVVYHPPLVTIKIHRFVFVFS